MLRIFIPRLTCKVLSYHRILPADLVCEQFTQKSLIVTVESFRRQMLYVRKKYRFITLEQLARMLRRGDRINKPSCAVTFDDGWRDNYLYAFPILQELQIPATVFVSVDHVESGKDFWPERLTRLLFSTMSTEENERVLLGVFSLPQFRTRDRLAYANLAIMALKQYSLEQVEKVLANLESKLVFKREHIRTERLICYWHELKEMAESRIISIGSHTLSHAILTNENRDTQIREIVESKKAIEEKMGIPAIHFAYPNGAFSNETESIVKRAGYRSACTCLNGINSCRTSPFRIRRIHVSEKHRPNPDRFSRLRFTLKMSNTFQQLKGAKNHFLKQVY
jgi:peptidoglycan/xylan/chitin deacetylase (PgdA/CDA1 family)